MPRFYLTTAIDYVNSRPHLGTAYEKITADVIARYKRLSGVDTHFLMGNDEHSQNVYKRAIDAGKDPLEYCDEMEFVFRSVWRGLTRGLTVSVPDVHPQTRTYYRRLGWSAPLLLLGGSGWSDKSLPAGRFNRLLCGRCGAWHTHLLSDADHLLYNDYFNICRPFTRQAIYHLRCFSFVATLL